VGEPLEPGDFFSVFFKKNLNFKFYFIFNLKIGYTEKWRKFTTKIKNEIK